jgi:hypothetical protein
MHVPLHTHSAHINILLNPDVDPRKKFTFCDTGGANTQHIAVAQVKELAEQRTILQIQKDAA